MPLRLKVAGKTDKGLVRPGNEDHLHLDLKNNVFAICDGMGGAQAGEVASYLAGEVLHRSFNQFSNQLLDDPALNFDAPVPATGGLLLRAIRLANRAIFRKSAADSALSGMGTTIVALAFEADHITIAHVGDSRAYRLEQKALIPLTIDHSWLNEIQRSQQITIEEASNIVGKNIITRALGVREWVDVDYRALKVQAGEIFILCSDGLCGYSDDDEIQKVAVKYRENVDDIVDNLVRLALDRGAPDNVTVVAVQVVETTSTGLPTSETATLAHESDSTLGAEDRWLEKFEATPQPAVESTHKPNKAFLIGMFALFAVISVLIIVFGQGK
ncbi:MAG: serine/threonine-protein phosphatase [bacterium]|nr:serine/threonine-protein phosphatase [bacterium]